MAGGAPTETFPAGFPFYRVHRANRSSAFFDTGPHGRFNPPDSHVSAFGTLYLATSPEGAFIETLGRLRHIPTTDIAARRLTRCSFERPLQMFRVSSPNNRFRYPGIDLAAQAVASTSDYAVTRRLAALVREDTTGSFDGLSYAARHDNSHELMNLAVFGPPGSHDPSTVFADHKTDTIPDELVEQMEAAYGFQVLPTTPLP